MPLPEKACPAIYLAPTGAGAHAPWRHQGSQNSFATRRKPLQKQQQPAAGGQEGARAGGRPQVSARTPHDRGSVRRLIDPDKKGLTASPARAGQLPLAPLDSGRKIEQALIDAIDGLDLHHLNLGHQILVVAYRPPFELHGSGGQQQRHASSFRAVAVELN